MPELEANNSGEIIPVNFSGPSRGPKLDLDFFLPPGSPSQQSEPPSVFEDPTHPWHDPEYVTGRERLKLGAARHERGPWQPEVQAGLELGSTTELSEKLWQNLPGRLADIFARNAAKREASHPGIKQFYEQLEQVDHNALDNPHRPPNRRKR